MKVINLDKVVREPIKIIMEGREITIPFVPNRIFLPFFKYVDDLKEGNMNESILNDLFNVTSQIFNLNKEGFQFTSEWVSNNLSLEMIIELFTELINAGNDMKDTTKEVKKNS